MDHAVAMRGGQRPGYLLDDAADSVELQRPPGQDLRQAAAAQEPHHQVRTVRPPPPVVDRDDVRVLQARHPLGLGLEPADELRVIGQHRPDRLDRHLPAHLGLHRTIHHPQGALANLFQQPIAPQRLPLQLQGRVVSQDLLVQALQGRGGVDPQLLGQGLAGLLVGPERLGLAT
jgi:hypothetical protein